MTEQCCHGGIFLSLTITRVNGRCGSKFTYYHEENLLCWVKMCCYLYGNISFSQLKNTYICILFLLLFATPSTWKWNQSNVSNVGRGGQQTTHSFIKASDWLIYNLNNLQCSKIIYMYIKQKKNTKNILKKEQKQEWLF